MTGVAAEEMLADATINTMFRRRQREEDERKGDFGAIGSRYGYVTFAGASLRVNKAIRNQVANLHGTLGHPSNERLARMLHLQGAKKEVAQAAKDIGCEICARARQPLSAPQVGATNPGRFNAHISAGRSGPTVECHAPSGWFLHTAVCPTLQESCIQT